MSYTIYKSCQDNIGRTLLSLEFSIIEQLQKVHKQLVIHLLFAKKSGHGHFNTLAHNELLDKLTRLLVKRVNRSNREPIVLFSYPSFKFKETTQQMLMSIESRGDASLKQQVGSVLDSWRVPAITAQGSCSKNGCTADRYHLKEDRAHKQRQHQFRWGSCHQQNAHMVQTMDLRAHQQGVGEKTNNSKANEKFYSDPKALQINNLDLYNILKFILLVSFFWVRTCQIKATKNQFGYQNKFC